MTYRSTFLDACRRKKVSHTPIWFMRQAGRSLPEYRRIREKYDVLTICKTPELAGEVALQPVRILGVDAAILFADIMIPVLALGMKVTIQDTIGPVIGNPIQSLKDVKKLAKIDPEKDFSHVGKTIRLIQGELKGKIPLIGFAGAPFTLASYLIEGKSSRDFLKTKLLMYKYPAVWKALMAELTNVTIAYLDLQAKAGVDALQLFDSWAGSLESEDYKTYVEPFTRKIFRSLEKFAIPRIHFGTNTAGLLKIFSAVGCDVVGVDWRIPIDTAWREIGYAKAIQGNLDPAVLLGEFSLVKKRACEILARTRERNGFIFNVGHGILPNTPVKNIIQLVEYVHRA